MSLRLLIDMNLSPEWVATLAQHGYDAVHWLGDYRMKSAAVAFSSLHFTGDLYGNA